MHPKRVALLLLLLLLGISISSVARAQVNIDAYRDYFLVGQFGEVCTMCEVVVLCRAGETIPEFESVPSTGSFSLYHLRTRTFWSQMGTIWEWFIANFTADELAAKGHTRPVEVYEIENGVWRSRTTVEARLRLDPGLLDFGPDVIDRVDSAWYRDGSAARTGFCQRLPLWESLDVIEAQTGPVQ